MLRLIADTGKRGQVGGVVKHCACPKQKNWMKPRLTKAGLLICGDLHREVALECFQRSHANGAILHGGQFDIHAGACIDQGPGVALIIDR